MQHVYKKHEKHILCSHYTDPQNKRQPAVFAFLPDTNSAFSLQQPSRTWMRATGLGGTGAAREAGGGGRPELIGTDHPNV